LECWGDPDPMIHSQGYYVPDSAGWSKSGISAGKRLDM